MMNGISGSSGYFAQQMSMQGMRQRPGSEERFNKLDADGNGGVDQAELQTMADNISAKTGQEINVEEASATYDANNDGLLDRDEMQSMMTELRDKMGDPQGGPLPRQVTDVYQAESEKKDRFPFIFTEKSK